MLSCQKNVKYQPDILIVQLQCQMKRLMNPHQTFFLPHFLGKSTNFSYLIFLGTHKFFLPHFLENPQFFLPHFFGKPTNFSYLIFLGNLPIFPTSFSWETNKFFLPHFFWETHQFFLPHFFGKPTNLVNETLKETPPHEVFCYYLCYHLELLQAFHNEGRYHWYLQNDTSIVILSDKSIEKFKFENLKWCKPVPQARSFFSQNLQKSHRKWDLRVSLRVSLTQISRNLTGSGI